MGFFTKNIEQPKTKEYLVAYHWHDALTGTRGESAIIVKLNEYEKMNSSKIKELQEYIQKEIVDTKDTYKNVVIVSFSKLED